MTPPATMQQHALAWLRRAIVERRLRPGERVLQDQIAEEIGVSVVPVREALRVLEAEGQLTYRPRAGYFVTELRLADLREIYELRQLLEELAVRRALPALDEDGLIRMTEAAEDCSAASAAADVARQLEANRRFHWALFEPAESHHLLRLIGSLWDATGSYRALYYNLEGERRAADEAHARILAAARAGAVDELVAELDHHRSRAIQTLAEILGED